MTRESIESTNKLGTYGGYRGHNVMSHFVLLLILNPTANFLIDFCANKNNFTKHIIAAQTKLILSFMETLVQK